VFPNEFFVASYSFSQNIPLARGCNARRMPKAVLISLFFLVMFRCFIVRFGVRCTLGSRFTIGPPSAGSFGDHSGALSSLVEFRRLNHDSRSADGSCEGFSRVRSGCAIKSDGLLCGSDCVELTAICRLTCVLPSEMMSSLHSFGSSRSARFSL